MDMPNCKNCQYVQPGGIIRLNNLGQCEDCGRDVAPKQSTNYTAVEILADLYEIRKPYMGIVDQAMSTRARDFLEKQIENTSSYQLITSIIALLSDKYKIDQKEISETLHERHIEKLKKQSLIMGVKSV